MPHSREFVTQCAPRFLPGGEPLLTLGHRDSSSYGWVQGWILSMENGGYRSLAKQLHFHQWAPFHPRIQIPVAAQLPVNFRDNCPTLAFVQDGCSSS
jgi:hypothetical protein